MGVGAGGDSTKIAELQIILDESLGFRPEIMEHQLAHRVKDLLGRAYSRTSHLDERKAMMQAWANYLGNITPNREGKAR